MKKLFLLPAILFASLVLTTSVFATSGCCSGHGGVNCGAGAQSNGRVICNDGWTGSSCSYSSMVMCGGSTSNSTTTNTYVAPTATLAPVYVPPVVTVEPTSTPSPEPTDTPTPTLTPSPTISPTPTVSPTDTPTTTSSERNTPAEIPVWKFHWWNWSPLMGLLGLVLQWK